MKISTLSPVTSQKKTSTKIPGKKFWEYLRIGKTIEPLLFINLNEEGYTSLADGEKKETKEFFLHTTLKKVDGKDTYPEIVCTSGCDPYNQKPCLGCFMQQNFKFQKGVINPWKRKLTTKWIILHLAWYYKVPRTDDKGEQVVYNDQPSFIHVLQTEASAEKYEGTCEKYFGKVLKMDIGSAHSKGLLNIRKNLYWTCQGCMMKIVTNNLSCPECDREIMKVNILAAEGKTLDEKLDSIRMLIATPHACICGYRGTMVEGNDCCYTDDYKAKKRGKKCPFDAPVRGDVFGTVTFLTKEGEQATSSLVMKNAYSIYNQAGDRVFDLPVEVLDEFPNMEVDKILDIIKARAIKEAVDGGVNLDLDKEIESFMLPLEQQAEVLGIPMPQALSSGPRLPQH